MAGHLIFLEGLSDDAVAMGIAPMTALTQIEKSSLQHQSPPNFGIEGTTYASCLRHVEKTIS